MTSSTRCILHWLSPFVGQLFMRGLYTSFNLAMAENNYGGVFNLFLGPKSSFCGSFYSDDLGESSLFVDFQSDISRSYHHQKVRNIIFLC